jgi:hypothetical protein
VDNNGRWVAMLVVRLLAIAQATIYVLIQSSTKTINGRIRKGLANTLLSAKKTIQKN